MYDDRNRYDRQNTYDNYDRRRESFDNSRGSYNNSRENFKGGRDNFDMENSRRFRSEQTSKAKGVKGFFNGIKNEQPTPNRENDLSNVVIYSPTTFDDVQALIDYLKRREQVIVDFSGIDQTAVYRIMDFMSGAIYALNGSIQQITSNIFLFAPAGVTITVPPQFKGKK